MYGASAKGSTLVNLLGLTSKEVSCCFDGTPSKVGLHLPGSGIPIVAEEEVDLCATPVLLTAWNYMDEVLGKAAAYRERGGAFIVPVPWPRVV